MNDFILIIIGGAVLALAAIIIGLILLYKVGRVKDKTKLTIFAIFCFIIYYLAFINPFVLRLL